MNKKLHTEWSQLETQKDRNNYDGIFLKTWE